MEFKLYMAGLLFLREFLNSEIARYRRIIKKYPEECIEEDTQYFETQLTERTHFRDRVSEAITRATKHPARHCRYEDKKVADLHQEILSGFYLEYALISDTFADYTGYEKAPKK